MTELTLRVEPADARRRARSGRPDASRLRAAFILRVPVTLCAAGTLPRAEMKSGRWVRK